MRKQLILLLLVAIACEPELILMVMLLAMLNRRQQRIKIPGEQMEGTNIELIAGGDSSAVMLPYERLLGDAIDGDAALFTRDDCVEAASQTFGVPIRPDAWEGNLPIEEVLFAHKLLCLRKDASKQIELLDCAHLLFRAGSKFLGPL